MYLTCRRLEQSHDQRPVQLHVHAQRAEGQRAAAVSTDGWK